MAISFFSLPVILVKSGSRKRHPQRTNITSGQVKNQWGQFSTNRDLPCWLKGQSFEQAASL